MAEERVQRRLATILAADVVGYSRLVEADEAGTLAALKARRRGVVEPLIAKHDGRIFKITGDGVLVEFASAVNAVQCAVDLQHDMAVANGDLSQDRCIALRIGVNLGDIVVEGNDLYGDGVNIAARLESLAEPGGIRVSGTAYDHVRNKVNVRFEDLGAQNLKNIAEPVRTYRVVGTPAVSIVASVSKAGRPSIAVLPFTNMSSDPEQEYFADGLAEDLITDLSKVRGLVVIARNSTFAYKGRPVDVRTVAKELDVRYLVEGSVRRASTRVRINVQLIDAIDNSHLWADRFDRDLADIFVLQDEVVGKIVSALADVLPSSGPVARKRATNLPAYDLFVRGRVMALQSPESNKAAFPILERSIEIDPDFAEAHAWLAMTHHFGWMYWGHAVERHRSLAREVAKRAVLLDPDNADAHMILGHVRAYDNELPEGIAEIETALRINPNHADAWALQTDLMVLDGQALKAIGCAQNAFRLNPFPPGVYYWVLGFAQYAAGQYKDAVETLQHDAARGTGSQRLLAGALAQLGRIAEAKEEARLYLARIPHFSVQNWSSTQYFRHDRDRQHFIDGYIKAGFPMRS